jgi:hypothetical protein
MTALAGVAFLLAAVPLRAANDQLFRDAVRALDALVREASA